MHPRVGWDLEGISSYINKPRRQDNRLFRSGSHKMLQRVKAINMLSIIAIIRSLPQLHLSAVPVDIRMRAGQLSSLSTVYTSSWKELMLRGNKNIYTNKKKLKTTGETYTCNAWMHTLSLPARMTPVSPTSCRDGVCKTASTVLLYHVDNYHCSF